MTSPRKSRIPVALVAVLLLAGCNGSGGQGLGPTPPPGQSSFVYYTTTANMAVVGYPINGTASLIATLTPSAANGLGGTANMAFDANAGSLS